MSPSNINSNEDRDERLRRRNDTQKQRLAGLEQILRDEIGDLEPSESVLVPLQEEDRVPLIMDASNLNEEELDELKKDDPFMYYSIPSIRRSTLRGSMTVASSTQGSVGASDRHLHLRQSAPAALMRAPFDLAVETRVRRRSRITFELSFDSMMNDIIESIDEGLDAVNDEESFDDILDRLTNFADLSVNLSSRRPSA